MWVWGLGGKTLAIETLPLLSILNASFHPYVHTFLLAGMTSGHLLKELFQRVGEVLPVETLDRGFVGRA